MQVFLLQKMAFALYLRSAKIMSRSPEPSPELCRDFHQHIREGNIDGILKLLEIEPTLVNARNADQATALMVTTTHPDTQRALEMIELLYERGAYLGPHDSDHRHVLLYACVHDADVAVVDKLRVWNAQQRKRKFRWNDRDSQGRTASVIASELANTPVTKFLLDRIDVWQSAKEHHSIKVLKVAIESGNEKHALQVALHPTIQAWTKNPGRTLYVGGGGGWHLFSTTGAAVDAGMLELVQVLNQLNQHDVSRAVWLKIHRLYRDAPGVLTTVPRVLQSIGMQFANVWRWKLVRDVCLVHYRCNQNELEGERCLLARLPDVVFRIVAFVVPPPFQLPPEGGNLAEKVWCDVMNLSEDWRVFRRCGREAVTNAATGTGNLRPRRLQKDQEVSSDQVRAGSGQY